MPSIYKPLSAFVAPASLAGAPAALHQALEQTEVFCSSQASSSFQAKISWIDGWWFSLAGGNGHIVIRDAAGTRNAGYFILFLPLSGQNWRSGSASSIYRPGKMVLTNWAEPAEVVSQGAFRYLMVDLPATALGDAAASFMAAPSPLTASCFSGIGAVLASALRMAAYQAHTRARQAQLSAILPELSQLVLKTFQTANEPAQAAHGPHQSERWARIVSYLEETHADERMCAKQAALACGLSERQLYRVCAETGQTFASTLRRIRIDRARDLLLMEPEKPLLEVALATGFTSSATFSRIFHADTGTTPSAFRKTGLSASG